MTGENDRHSFDRGVGFEGDRGERRETRKGKIDEFRQGKKCQMRRSRSIWNWESYASKTCTAC